MGTERTNGHRFEARGIGKIFEQGKSRLDVLKGVNLAIQPGEMVAIVGKSGTGKTTLLQILGGLDRPTTGSMTFNGEDIFSKDDAELSAFRNRTIGFVFQFHHLLPEFTALENALLPGMICGIDRKLNLARATKLMERVGLADRIDHKIGELSGGEQQRVALARAIIMEPALLLADEPTGNLDPVTGNNVFALIKEMNRDLGLATVMVTHNYELSAQMDRCLTLIDGVLVEVDDNNNPDRPD
ncbi:MAG: ABC transporter ATP-binding protein [Proteobacteria bacterium]|nr:ABC transporter ATP-binding protein [Pseudomonadota bacterium]MBU1738636.1 ABC transporter ATP-binding protein [Pseudomonadota bacterium]